MGAPGVPPGRPRRAVNTRWTGPAAATGLYTIAAILLTWPLATALATAIPWDLGDPLLNAWIAAWGAAAVLSCGPSLRNGARVLEETAPYAWLYHHAPGFDGLRVPARFAMLVALALSVLASLGWHRLTHGLRRAVRWRAITAVLVFAEGGAAPLPLNAKSRRGSTRCRAASCT